MNVVILVVESIIETDSKFSEAVIYAMCNICKSIQLDKEETVEVINVVALGDSPKEPASQKLKIDDITRIAVKDK